MEQKLASKIIEKDRSIFYLNEPDLLLNVIEYNQGNQAYQKRKTMVYSNRVLLESNRFHSLSDSLSKLGFEIRSDFRSVSDLLNRKQLVSSKVKSLPEDQQIQWVNEEIIEALEQKIIISRFTASPPFP